MEEEFNPNDQPQGEDLSNWSFADESEVLAAQQAEEQPMEEQAEPEMVEDANLDYETSTEETQSEYIEDYSEEDVDEAVFDFLSERLGFEVNSYEDLLAEEQQQET